MQQSTASDFAMTAVPYGLNQQQQQQQGMAYVLMQQQQSISADLSTSHYGRASMYSDPVFSQGSYGLGQQSYGYGVATTEPDLALGSLMPLRYPNDVGHFHAQQSYSTWIHDDSHNQFQSVVRLSFSVPPGVPINSSFPDAVQSREGAAERFQDAQWPPKREPIREYVGQPLSYRGLGAPPRSESLPQVWRPGLSDTVRNMRSPFIDVPGVLAPKRRITVKTSKQNGPAGGVEGPGWCSLCRIDCITKAILEQHKTGKKHKKHLQSQEVQVTSGNQDLQVKHFINLQNKDLNVVKACSPMELQERSQHQHQVTGKEQQPDDKQNLQGKAQSVVCESKLGKRKENDKGTADDIARKCQKLLDVGTSIEAVKVCSLCNVVCNSQIVFDSHLSGRKHTARLKSLDEAGNPVMVAKNATNKSVAGVEVADIQDVNANLGVMDGMKGNITKTS